METIIEQFELALSGSPIYAYLLVYLAGILTSFTPCVLPLFPVAVGTITASARVREFKDGKLTETVTSRGRALLMGLSFALGLASMFSLLGLLAALSGKAIFGMLASSPLTYVMMMVIMLLLALWLIKGDKIDPGASLQNWAFKDQNPSGLKKIVRWYSSTQGGGAFTTFAFGFIYGIIAGPCTAPVIAAVLTYVAKAGEVFYGVSLMFVYAIGLATLMVIAGVSATLAMRLKSQGKVAEAVKLLFVIMLISMAGYFGYQALAISGFLNSSEQSEVNEIYYMTSFDEQGAKTVAARQTGEVLPNFDYAIFDSKLEIEEQTSKSKISLKDFKGKVVFVTFWGNWCKACKEEIVHIKEMQKKYKSSGKFEVISINVQDDPANVPGFAASLKINYPVIIDSENEYSEERLNLVSFPHNIILDQTGKIIYSKSLFPKNYQEIIDGLLNND